MFEKGSIVVYGQTGVCIVEDVTEKALIKNEKQLYYVLKPYFQQNNVIYAPVDSDKVFMRSLMNESEANELISKIPDITARITDEELNSEDCRMILSSHDPSDLITLTAKIYRKKKAVQAQKKKLSFADEKYMNIAENLLFGELALALGIEFDQVVGYIERKLKK